MPSIDVILESENVVALGGPTSIELQLDTGATGQRGSLAYIGAGLPSSSTIPNYSSILPGDLYINTAPGANYSWLYQYLVKPGGNTWEPILQLNPALYNAVHQVAFTAGTATISIPLSNITSNSTGLTLDNFAVNITFEHANPIAASISGKQITSGNLVLTIKALEYYSASWIDYVDSSAFVAVSARVIGGTTT
jgi:hypothetical protein